MATTDTKPGFRLPWSTDNRAATDEQATGTDVPVGDAAQPVGDGPATSQPAGVSATPSTEQDSHEPEAPVTPIAATPDHAVATDPQVPTTPAAERPEVPHRQTKFLADLTKAMQVAAQAEREETLGQYQAEAKAFIEQIRAGSGGRAADLRKQTDDDVAAIRDWSKAEMARIREETDRRIADRKADLDGQLQRHSTQVEREIELVQARIEDYEGRMARFFEQLLEVDDPTAFAAMAARLPEPPPFSVDLDEEPWDEPVAAVQSASTQFEAVDATEPAIDPVARESVPTAEAPDSADHDESDPRITALGLTPDFAAAEAEAAVDAASISGDGSEDVEGIPTVSDEDLAVRLAGLVPPADAAAAPTNPGAVATTQVAVVGLVSVASIAGFKRHLARVPGVQSVGVSSGPDGEFVFSVVHHEDVSLREIVPTLPGFRARVSSAGDGVVNITAHDPESDA
jgi:primosomal protein N''